ncbi:MAG: hypothetical protein NC399_06410 [Muribaculum sp.]|nr:hypothetical protein [Muribaculum sp.]
MTVSEAVITWLLTFNQADVRKMKKIDTDIQSAKVDSYALVKEPIRNVKSYISGKKEYTDHYTLRARLSAEENADRIENHGFGEALEDWLEEQDQKKNYPQIPHATVKGVSVTTPFYCGMTADHNCIYEMTVSVKYEKER